MLIKFIGDTHFGAVPSHSTKHSALWHKGMVSEALEKAHAVKADCTIQLGDLFDKYRVSNTSIREAFDAVNGKVDYVLRGNHDHSHNALHCPALLDLARLCPVTDFITVPSVFIIDPSVRLYVVPYMATQEAFEKALQDCLSTARKSVSEMLCLHTNMHPEGFSSAEIENNVSPLLAEKLTERFDLVVSGHEHNPSHKKGFLFTGCLVPFSFGEISSKYVWTYDTETKKLSRYSVWEPEVSYKKLSFIEFSLLTDSLCTGFLEVVGLIKPEEVLALAKRTGDLFANTEVIAIKNNTYLKTLPEEEKKAIDIPWEDKVSSSLSSPAKKLFVELLNADC